MSLQTSSLPLTQEPQRLNDYVLLTKPRLSSLVLLTTLVGFYFGSGERMDVLLLLDTLLGTALVAAGASALNQVLERRTDALMRRTENRPLPSRRMSMDQVLLFGAGAAIVGMFYLAFRVNLTASAFAAATLALYVFLYTPLKRRSTLNTLVGALPGALPPLIGWAAVHDSLDSRAWTLFAILFVWQLPHFLAIAWLYRADYARAGLRMLPVVDEDGFKTGRQMMLHSFSLLPLSLLPAYFGMAGPLYFVSALVLGGAFFGFALNFLARRDDAAARKLFLASVIYLPLLLAVMMFDSR